MFAYLKLYILKRDINAFESIQCRFSKCINGLKDFSYFDRLTKLGAHTLAKATL